MATLGPQQKKLPLMRPLPIMSEAIFKCRVGVARPYTLERSIYTVYAYDIPFFWGEGVKDNATIKNKS